MATILVVDDDKNNRLLVRMLAEYGGHRVLEAGDGASGLEISASQRPSLIVLDLSMPAMSGPEFMRELRKNAPTSETPVLLYTATPPDAAMRDFMTIYTIAGAVTKPSEPAELMGAIERALQE